MARVIEARAVISGEDRLSPLLDKINKNFKGLGRGQKLSAEVDKMAKSIERLGQQGAAVDKLQKQMASFGAARTRMREAQAAVEQTAKALASAGKPSRDLETAHRRAQAAVSAAAKAFDREKEAVLGAKAALSGFGSVGKLVRDQGQLASAVDKATAAMNRQMRSEERGRQVKSLALQRRGERLEREAGLAEKMAERHQARRDAGVALAGGAGIYASHKINEGTHATLETYRDFDRYSRQTEAFGNFTKPEMEKIIAMAIHGDPDTRFNDIQWLQGAKALGGRGVKAGSVMGILPEAGRYSQAMGTDLPEGVAGIEGSLFGFQRDLSTPEKAQAAARRTADLQVTAAKAFGLTHHDLKGGYEYGALGANMTGLSEEKLLAFIGLGKKLNIEGSAQGNAWRAMTGKFLSPTRKGREAMASVGVDYSSFQKMPDQLPVGNFQNMIAQQYGVKLDKTAQEKLTKAFQDKETFSDAGAFAIAVKDAIKGQVGAVDAKSANKVVGSAERFRQSNVQKVDVNALFDALMDKMGGGNLALANAVFGEKQGTRIMAALRDEDVWRHSVKKLEDAPEGKAREVSEKMSGGFEGAMARWEKATKNLETAFGRSWDKGGEGGFLTGVVDQSAKLVQSLAEMNSGVLQVGTGLAWLGGKAIGSAGTIGLMGSAFALTKSAADLSGAAIVLGGKATVGNAAAGAGAAAGGISKSGALLAGLGTAGAIGAGLGVIAGGVYLVDQSLPNHNRMNGNGKGVQGRGPGAYMPGSWGSGGVDVSGGIGATGGSFVTNRPKTWGETIFGGQATFRGGRDPTRMQLPNFDSGRQMRMPDSRLDASTRGPITAVVKTLPPLSGEVKGQATVSGSITVEPSQWFTTKFAGLEQSVMQLSGKISSIGASVATNGPGSTGKSSPDAGKGGRD